MDLPDDVAAAVAPLESGYAGLLELVSGVLAANPGVRALWLGGSVGRGVADAGSDLDLIVTVTSVEAFEEPVLWAVVEPVITTPIPGMPGCFAFTTRQGLRLDVVLETPADVAHTSYVRRVCVFDHDGLTLPAPDVEGRGPDVARMQAIVTEFLRTTPIFPAAVVAREDWLLGWESVHLTRGMLYDLFVEANQPLPAMGIKQWSSRLTTEQQAILAELRPPAGADRESVIAAMTAVRHALRTHGRAALESAGGEWPTEVDDALDVYWRRHGLA